MKSRQAPIEINISAKFKIAKYLIAMKSITCPTKIRSYACESAPAMMSVYPASRSLDLFGYSVTK